MFARLSALNEWNLSSEAQFHRGIQSVLLSGKKTLTRLTVLELLSASKGLKQTAAYIRWWIPTHIQTHNHTHAHTVHIPVVLSRQSATAG